MNRRNAARGALTWATFGSSVVAAAVLSVIAKPAAAAGCTGGVQSPGSDGYTQVLAVILDDTQERTEAFRQKVVDTVAEAARRPRLRLVLWRFGGVRPLPDLLADVTTLSPRPNGKQDLEWLARVATRPSGSDEAERACAAAKADELRSTFLAKLKAALAVYDSSDDSASPIVLAVDQAVAPFVLGQPEVPIKLLLVSDGLEHSKALSYYPVNNLYLSAAEAVSKTASLYRGTWRAQVNMAGIGVTRASDPAAVGALVDIWKALITARGGSVGELSTSVPQRLADSPPSKGSAGGQ